MLSAIGAGGMGEVYRARDTKLKRDVALKVLPDSFTSDPDRLARFQREAEMLAALNHPHIAHIHGLEESDGVRALVLEFVDGPTLADRITQGPISLDEALPVARQIAEALEAAHEQGIIHRDLKPANIKVRLDGTVKVLDFGLAKALEPGGTMSPGVTQSPTITSPAMMTGTGMLLGTAAYMSPEQARGRAADKRSDIWAFGCVLFEMLTGRRAFDGADVADTLASILAREPDWSALPPSTPSAVHRVLRRCLQKDRRERLADIADARLELAEPATSSLDHAAGNSVPSSRIAASERVAWTGAVLTAAAIAAWLYLRPLAVTPALLRASIPLPADTTWASGSVPIVSPDGRSIAFVGVRDGTAEVWVRSVDSMAARALAGTDGAVSPFWSPDSRSIGFFAGGQLKKIDVAGGSAVPLCDSRLGRGGTWSKKGVIVFAPSTTGTLYRVAAAGGRPEPVTALPPRGSGVEISHRWPSFLPDDDHFLYAATDGNSTKVYIAALSSRDRKLLLDDTSNAQYVASGYLLYLKNRMLFAQAFDNANLTMLGDALPVVESVDYSADNVTGTFVGMFSASQTGDVLAFTSGRLQTKVRLAWFDRTGKEVGNLGLSDDVRWPSISPDGSSIVYSQRNARTGFYELWLHDLKRKVPRRLTTSATSNANWPVWSPDSARVAFSAIRDGTSSLFVQPTQGGARDELLHEGATGLPMDWSRDGQYLIYQTSPTRDSAFDLWVLPLKGDRKPYPYVNSQASERRPRISPNGRWATYMSDETTRFEIYVESFPKPGSKWTVTSTGGGSPVWSRDGSELFFVSPDRKFTVVSVSDGASFEVGPPRLLFQVAGFNEIDGWFDVSSDGRFLIPIVAQDGAAAVPISVWANWRLP